MSEPFIKKAPARQGGGEAEKGDQFSPKIITQKPEPPEPLYCFGHAHESCGRGDCSTCPKAAPCALITPIWIQHEDRLRRRSRRNLVDSVHRNFGYPRRMLETEYSEVFGA